LDERFSGHGRVDELFGLAVSPEKISSVPAYQVLVHLAEHAPHPLNQLALQKAQAVEEIRKGEEELYRGFIGSLLTNLRGESKRMYVHSGISFSEVCQHFDTFKKCLYYVSDLSLPHPYAKNQSVSTFVTDMRIKRESALKKKRKRENEKLVGELFIPVHPNTFYDGWQNIGKGGFGTVYSAYSKASKKRVAIKHMIRRKGKESKMSEIIKEIRLLIVCDHPNIVDYLDAYHFQQQVWVVMEYCEGGTLRTYSKLSAGVLTESVIAFVCAEVAKALDYLHNHQQLVHRDIKGENVLLSLSGDVKLADFGLCCSPHKFSSTICGSKHYISPEIINLQPIDYKADIWGIGCLIIEMLQGGRPPYPDCNSLKALFYTATRGAQSFEVLNKNYGYSSLLAHFYSKCLAYQPQMRFTASQLLQHEWITSNRTDKKKLAATFSYVFLQQALLDSGLF